MSKPGLRPFKTVHAIVALIWFITAFLAFSSAAYLVICVRASAHHDVHLVEMTWAYFVMTTATIAVIQLFYQKQWKKMLKRFE